MVEPEMARKMLLGVNVKENPDLNIVADAAMDKRDLVLSKSLSYGVKGEKKNKECSFLFSPVYKENTSLDTVKKRRDALKGWIVAALSEKELLTHALEDIPDGFAVKMFVQGTSKPFFTSSNAFQREFQESLFHTVRLLKVGEKNIRLEVFSSSLTEEKERSSNSVLLFLEFLFLILGWRFTRQLMIERGDAIQLAQGMEQEVHKSEQVFQDMFYKNETPMFLVDPSDNWKFLDVNDAACHYSGYSRKELSSMHVSDLNTEPFEKIQEKLKHVMDGHIKRMRTYHRLKSGDIRTVEISTSPLEIHGKGCYVSLVHDVTDQEHYEEELYKKNSALQELNAHLEERVAEEIAKQKEQEQVLVQQSKMAAMGEMMNSVAHQWRQPLNALGIIIQDIRDAFEYGALTNEYIDNIEKTAMQEIEKMSRIIDDFSSYFRTDEKNQPFSIFDETSEVQSLLKPQLEHHRIKLTVHCINPVDVLSGEPYIVYGSTNKYAQVLFTLIANAKDAILEKRLQKKKEQDNSAEPEEGKIIFEFRATQDEILIDIADNGCGIPADILPRIFEPYYTTKVESGGVGMGLYISKMIVEKDMKGNIRIQSAYGWTHILLSFPHYKEEESGDRQSNDEEIIF